MNRRVALVYVTGKLRPQTLAALEAQWPDFEPWEHDPGDDYSQSDTWRKLWRTDGDLVVVEQDVIPQPGAIQAMFDCPNPWCWAPQWNGTTYVAETVSLVKFGHDFRQAHIAAADFALAGQWLRRPQKCLRPGEPDPHPGPDPAAWATDFGKGADGAWDRRVDWMLNRQLHMIKWPSDARFGSPDALIGRELRVTRAISCGQHAPSIHLHEYSYPGSGPDPLLPV